MAKFRCICGETISTSGTIPNPDEWLVFSDSMFSSFFELDPDVMEMSHSAVFMFRCPTSDHLWIFWDGIDVRPALYTPTELPQPEGW